MSFYYHDRFHNGVRYDISDTIYYCLNNNQLVLTYIFNFLQNMYNINLLRNKPFLNILFSVVFFY